MKKKKNWWTPIVHWFVHMVVGTAIFALIAAFAIGVDVLVVHKLVSWGASEFTTRVLSFLAEAVLAGDSVCFLYLLITSVVDFFKGESGE